MSHGLQQSEEDSMIDEAFELLDKDKDGTICISELGMVMRAMNQNPTTSDLEHIMKNIDKNKSGKIDKSEFKDVLKKYRQKAQNDAQQIQRAFNMFDTDGSGVIDCKELKAMMVKFGQNITDQEIANMIEVADINKDGRINIDEFTKFICQPLQPTSKK